MKRIFIRADELVPGDVLTFSTRGNKTVLKVHLRFTRDKVAVVFTDSLVKIYNANDNMFVLREVL